MSYQPPIKDIYKEESIRPIVGKGQVKFMSVRMRKVWDLGICKFSEITPYVWREKVCPVCAIHLWKQFLENLTIHMNV